VQRSAAWAQRQAQGRSGAAVALDPQAEASRWLAAMKADETQRPLTGDALIRVLMEMLLMAKTEQQPPPRQDEECVVCMESPRSVTLTPCGHRVMCAACCANVRAASGEVGVAHTQSKDAAVSSPRH
jgi:hypothetical protein